MANSDSIDKITSWASNKYRVEPTPAATGGTGLLGLAAGSSPLSMEPTKSGGYGTMNSDGSGTETMWKSQPNVSTPTAVAPPSGMLGSTTSAPAQKTDYTTQLNDLYRTTLKRDGDAAGMKWFADNLASGATTLDGVRNALVNSDEYAKANSTIPTPATLTARTIDQPTQTVQGQLSNVLAADSPVLQQARAEGQRQAADRGLLNSSIAASAGTDAMVRAATGIATSDAQTYSKAADYNTAASNELFMYNTDQVNQFKKLEAQLGSEAAARAMQVDLAKMQDATTKAGQANQMTIASMQDQTNRWQQEQQTANSRYNTDASYKQQVDTQKQSMANNIIHNMDMSPDRKAALLEQLGFGTSASANGPGTGLAGAVYVIDSVGQDLNFASTVGSKGMLDTPGAMY